MSPAAPLPRWRVVWRNVNDDESGVAFVEALNERTAFEIVRERHPTKSLVAIKIVPDVRDP